MKLNLAFGIALAALLAGDMTTVVLSRDTRDDDLSADEIFKKARENYAALASYRDEGKVVAVLNGTVTTTTFAMRLARPNYYYVKWSQYTDCSDCPPNASAGKVWSSGAGNFLRAGYEIEDKDSPVGVLSAAAVLSGGAAATIPMRFFNIQFNDPLGGWVREGDRQPDEKVGPSNCYVFTRESPGRTITVWIGQQDFLVHQFRTIASAEIVPAPAAQWSPESRHDLHRVSFTETHANIVVNQSFQRSDFRPSSDE
jgi:hypothetical protein